VYFEGKEFQMDIRREPFTKYRLKVMMKPYESLPKCTLKGRNFKGILEENHVFTKDVF